MAWKQVFCEHPRRVFPLRHISPWRSDTEPSPDHSRYLTRGTRAHACTTLVAEFDSGCSVVPVQVSPAGWSWRLSVAGPGAPTPCPPPEAGGRVRQARPVGLRASQLLGQAIPPPCPPPGSPGEGKTGAAPVGRAHNSCCRRETSSNRAELKNMANGEP